MWCWCKIVMGITLYSIDLLHSCWNGPPAEMVISRAMLLAIGYQRYHLYVVVVGYFLVFESMCSAFLIVWLWLLVLLVVIGCYWIICMLLHRFSFCLLFSSWLVVLSFFLVIVVFTLVTGFIVMVALLLKYAKLVFLMKWWRRRCHIHVFGIVDSTWSPRKYRFWRFDPQNLIKIGIYSCFCDVSLCSTTTRTTWLITHWFSHNCVIHMWFSHVFTYKYTSTWLPPIFIKHGRWKFPVEFDEFPTKKPATMRIFQLATFDYQQVDIKKCCSQRSQVKKKKGETSLVGPSLWAWEPTNVGKHTIKKCVVLYSCTG